MVLPLAFGMPGPLEWVIIAAIGLLLFGKRLPEVGRSVGRSIVEFKKGLKGVEDDLEQIDAPAPRKELEQERQQPYKFDPYTGKPAGDDAARHSGSG